MRGLPFFKPKNKLQFAGMNFSNDTSGGGGGSYTLPTATASRLGGVKIGSGINVAGDGTISASGGGNINISTDETQIGAFMGVSLYARVFDISLTVVGTSYTTLVSNVGYIKKLFNVVLLSNAYSDSNNYTVVRGVNDVRISSDGELQADTIDSGGATVRTVIAIYTKE